MGPHYNREAELRERFNRFVSDKITGIVDDYYARLKVEDFEDIKTTLRDINNIITYKATVRLLEWVRDRFPYVRDNYEFHLDQVLKTKPNDNGYDLTVVGDVNIIAEVKCNRPINDGYKFGSQQKAGIVKDIQGLLNGKSKATSVDPTQAFKFAAIYDFGDRTISAVNHLIRNLSTDLKERVTIYKEGQLLTKDKVHIVFIK
ncbi:hypothetical protein [Alicyclobacillus sp. SO9]|uniref:hypothetical protein n=1 Tax=Alicyclobacillus sp. SO9 TaxID=2665646 RepID=UPI0018E7ED53|nr:hypothetical protein [Alicyclobacillus sp. SO9]QQE80465.1 hypothetical protein GI364_08665 [Alicyclobacillus sp. SO9]